MSNLPVEFNEFHRAKGQVFSVRGSGSLDIEAACPVAILKGETNKISVEIDADQQDLENFKVQQQGNTVLVHQNGAGSGTNISINGGSVNISNGSFGSISVTGGGVFVNGQRVEAGQHNTQQSTKTPLVIIRTPENGNLDARLSGGAFLASEVPHNEADIDTSGQTRIGVAARDLTIDASGQSQIKAFVGGGELDIDLSGQGSAHVKGAFSKVKAELSGQGSIQTEGVVKGSYKADASGMGNIVHRGQVHGRIRKDTSGMAHINIG